MEHQLETTLTNKVLVIHPVDRTTAFLKQSYCSLANQRGWTVIHDYNPSSGYLKKMIKEHDIIVMMGHGTEEGLIGFNRFVINSKLVYLLREKKGFYVWCNADKFVKKYNLSGFYTGMIISESDEADYMGVDATEKEINMSNNNFSESLRQALECNDPLSKMLEVYIADTSVSRFNKDRLYQKNFF